MKIHEFFAKYANTPLEERKLRLKNGDINENYTLDDLFFELKKIQEKMRPFVIERDSLLRKADKHYYF